MFKGMRFLLAGAAALALGLGVSGQDASAQTKTKLTVYTALENDQLGVLKKAFEADTPDVEIQWIRDSTGIITARLLAEKSNPKADVVWGLAASSIVLFDQQGMIEAYAPKGVEALKPAFRSPKKPETWTGMDAYLSLICFNTAEAAKDKTPKPESWKDLLKPAYKGKIVMPNPASSGTGYLTVVAWINLMGEAEAWKFMDALHENIGLYTHSGSAPCVQAAKGERMIGIGLDMRGAKLKTEGAPIDVILPKEGAGWEMEATAIVKGTKNLAAAKKLVDWSVTKKANEAYGKFYAIVAYPGVNATPPNYPADAEKAMVKVDLAKAASERERILAEWTKRYDKKSAPK
ncbi:MAG: putative 2-aminoethylphosphonate ABC transporter substrate-binding protein [Alphaproteobacteria bacterium]